MKRLFSLSPRLQAVAALVPQGTLLADVGTDHGRLPVWLLRQDRVSRVVASDLRPGPLSRAQALAERWDVTDRVSFRLCDGLTAILSEEAHTVTITGMGGETIADILQAVPWSGGAGHRYILQPMSGMDGLRRYLSGHGFSILREVLVPEGDTIYVILLAEPGPMPPLSEGEIWAGRQTPGDKAPFRSRYLSQELDKLHRAVEGLCRSQQPEDMERRLHFELVAAEVAQMKKEWDQWQQ